MLGAIVTFRDSCARVLRINADAETHACASDAHSHAHDHAYLAQFNAHARACLAQFDALASSPACVELGLVVEDYSKWYLGDENVLRYGVICCKKD